jgi:WD40 repeat protein
VATGQVRATLEGHDGQVTAVAVAPDGSWLVSGVISRSRSRPTRRGRKNSESSPTPRQVGPVRLRRVGPRTPGGNISGGGEGAVRIWDVATGQVRATLEGHAGQVTAVAVAPDGSWLATGGGDGAVRIWDVATSQRRTILTGHDRKVTAVAVAPDASWLATGGEDGVVRIWDVATRQRQDTHTGHVGQVTAVAVAPDGSWLATGGDDGTVRIWDIATRQARALMRLENSVKTGAWLGVNTLAVGGLGGLYLFDFLMETSTGAATH